jgi:hypothetical protein
MQLSVYHALIPSKLSRGTSGADPTVPSADVSSSMTVHTGLFVIVISSVSESLQMSRC